MLFKTTKNIQACKITDNETYLLFALPKGLLGWAEFDVDALAGRGGGRKWADASKPLEGDSSPKGSVRLSVRRYAADPVVRVCRAAKLRNADRPTFRNPSNKSDPYVRLSGLTHHDKVNACSDS